MAAAAAAEEELQRKAGRLGGPREVLHEVGGTGGRLGLPGPGKPPGPLQPAASLQPPLEETEGEKMQ